MMLNPSIILLLIWSVVCFSDEHECRTVARMLPPPISAGNDTAKDHKKIYENVEIIYSDANDFQITKRLGAGSYGEAYLGHNITSMEQYVFKLYRFGKLKRKKMLREILVTQSVCGHPNIIKLLHVIRQSLTDYPVLVFEHAKSIYYRDLFPILKPEDVKYYMYEILKGLAYAHERGVMHKDLKPANIMINHQERVVKIIDWGLSQFYFNKESQSVAGSMYYKSPEMLLDYDMSSMSTDIWSLGCIFAAMLYRKTIFFTGEDNTGQILEIAKILGTDALLTYNQKYNLSFNTSSITQPFPRRTWHSLVEEKSRDFATDEALHLLEHMLVYDQEKRITARDALQHPYFRSLRTVPIRPGPTTPTTTSVTTTARYTIVSHRNRDPGNSNNLRGTAT